MIPGEGRGAGFVRSFGFAFQGVRAAFKGRNFRIQAALAVLAALICAVLRTEPAETAVVLICIGLVLAGECLNTSLEALVDLVSPDFHPLAKVAKDCAAGAVLILSIASFIIALVVFLPRVL